MKVALILSFSFRSIQIRLRPFVLLNAVSRERSFSEIVRKDLNDPISLQRTEARPLDQK